MQDNVAVRAPLLRSQGPRAPFRPSHTRRSRSIIHASGSPSLARNAGARFARRRTIVIDRETRSRVHHRVAEVGPPAAAHHRLAAAAAVAAAAACSQSLAPGPRRQQQLAPGSAGCVLGIMLPDPAQQPPPPPRASACLHAKAACRLGDQPPRTIAIKTLVGVGVSTPRFASSTFPHRRLHGSRPPTRPRSTLLCTGCWLRSRARSSGSRVHEHPWLRASSTSVQLLHVDPRFGLGRSGPQSRFGISSATAPARRDHDADDRRRSNRGRGAAAGLRAPRHRHAQAQTPIPPAAVCIITA